MSNVAFPTVPNKFDDDVIALESKYIHTHTIIMMTTNDDDFNDDGTSIVSCIYGL